MRQFRKEAIEWMDIAYEARRSAHEKQDNFTKPALQVADLCEHIAAAMERISDIVESVNSCECGQCPPPKPSHLQ